MTVISHIILSLISATPTEEDPVQLIITAGRAYVPIDQSAFLPPGQSSEQISSMTGQPSVDEAIKDITTSDWYKDQVVHRRRIDAKEAQIGEPDPLGR